MSNGNFEWSCPVCTLLNHIDNNLCTLCGASRVQSSNVNQDITVSQQNLLSSLATDQSSSKTETQNNANFNNNNNNDNNNNNNNNSMIEAKPCINNENMNSEDNKDDGMAVDETEKNGNINNNENSNEFEEDDDDNNNNTNDDDEFDDDNDGFEDDDDADDAFNDNDDDDGWGDDDLCYDEQKRIEHNEEEDCEAILKRAMEKRRVAQSKLDSFWKCGKCQFLNHPSRAVCMMCSMPQLDVVHHIMMCPKNELKVCVRCRAFVVPHLYDSHVLDCQPIAALDTEQSNQAWFVKLTDCEQKAINHVNALSIKKSSDSAQKLKLITLIKQIENGKYVSTLDNTLKALYHFLEWEVPIIIRIHIADLIPKIIKDTHYRNLFEVGKGSGGNDTNVRRTEEAKLFGPVYDKAKPFERPKYGCLNIGLSEAGTQQANMYGDGYFLMNDTTVRWRTTMTVMDSFSVNGDCGTVKHCNHLLTQLQPNELQEVIEAALTKKTTSGGSKQSAYREIQIHGPVQLNRDILSIHVPSIHKKNKKLVDTLNNFCQQNMCKLKYFDVAGTNNNINQYNNY